MNAIQLVATLQARGVELAPAAGRLRFRPPEAVGPEERDALRHHKREILALLTLDPTTVRDVLGPQPEPAAVAALRADVVRVVCLYQAAVATGALGPGVFRVRGRPLADYLALDVVARLLAVEPARLA